MSSVKMILLKNPVNHERAWFVYAIIFWTGIVNRDCYYASV